MWRIRMDYDYDFYVLSIRRNKHFLPSTTKALYPEQSEAASN